METENKPTPDNSKARRNIRTTVAIAASVILVVILFEAYKFYSLSPQKLFAQKYSAFELTRGSADTLSVIQKAYTEKKYAEIIHLNKNSVLSIHDVFLTGLAYLEIKDYTRAISSFQVVIADVRRRDKVLQQTAEYYLALAYLKNSDYDQAIELMNSIHYSASHLYSEKFSRNYINRVKRLKWR